MGIIKQGILGGFSNKVGSVVGSSWKGIAVMRSLPISVANPRTAAQVSQREEFAQTAKIASSMLAEVVQPCWNRNAKRMSGYNAFVKYNEKFADPSNFIQALMAFQYSVGDLNRPQIQATGDVLAGDSWSWLKNSNLGRYDRMDDAIVTVAVEFETDATHAVWTGASRAEILATAKRVDEQLQYNGIVKKYQNAVVLQITYVISADGTHVSTAGSWSVMNY